MILRKISAQYQKRVIKTKSKSLKLKATTGRIKIKDVKKVPTLTKRKPTKHQTITFIDPPVQQD